MSRLQGFFKRSAGAAAALAALSMATGPAQAVTVFENDVSTAIDRGIEWLGNNGVAPRWARPPPPPATPHPQPPD